MRVLARILMTVAAACVASAQSSPGDREPHLGYIYPAGGAPGTTFHVLAGGQRLRGVRQVYVTGDGVHATIIRIVPPLKKLERETVRAIRKRIEQVRRDPHAATQPSSPTSAPTTTSAPTSRPTTRPTNAAELDVDTLTTRELEYFAAMFQSRDKRQTNAQLADVILIEVTIDATAEPGDRELRLASPTGLTNPLRFEVGGLPETCEQEPLSPRSPPMSKLTPPFLLNGQIMPGDVDRFTFHAHAGQRLVMDVHARRLIPYLADAVPGWFQAVLAVEDAGGRELAFADDYRFSPDPVLRFEVPADGEYQLVVRDALWRGREDFVYRVTVAESPFVTQMFPLGGRAGSKRSASIAGWNLPRTRVSLDVQPGDEDIRRTSVTDGPLRSNDLLYDVSSSPEWMETEPDDDLQSAPSVRLPRMINGRIAHPGDVDVFKFRGRASQPIVAEVIARRLNSPLDSCLTILDASGAVLASNDDSRETATGLLTHYADSYLRVTLPDDGAYYVKVADGQQHGGDEYAYRLRIGEPQPDFELRLTPASVNVPLGCAVPVTMHVLRKDGFDGAIDLALTDAPVGFTLAGARIPAGRDKLRLTVAAPSRRTRSPVTLKLEGHACIDDETVARPVVPAEDMMQAFSYRHLVPCQELMVAVTSPRQRVKGLRVTDDLPVRIPAGGSAYVHVALPPREHAKDVRAELNEPPPGLRVQDVQASSEGWVITLSADAEAAQPGLEDNLIIELTADVSTSEPGKESDQSKRRASIGFLPAIPIEVVRGEGDR